MVLLAEVTQALQMQQHTRAADRIIHQRRGFREDLLAAVDLLGGQ